MKSIRNLCKQLAIAAACFLLVVSSITPVQAASSGKSGDASWKLENGILTISGRGEMADYVSSSDCAPWYENREEITKVIIEDGVTHVGESAFFECTSLTSVSMTNSVKSIGNLAFLKCKNLVSIQLSDNLNSIGHGAFKQCKSLTMISLPNGLKSIDYEAFFDCESLMSITIPNSVTSLGKSLFTYCDSLIQANILANVEVLPAWTFYGCSSLTDVSLSNSIIEVGQDSFKDCDSLNKVQGELSNEVFEDIKNQTDEEISNEEITDSTGHKSDEVIENEHVTVNGTFNKEEIIVNATVKDDDGWETVINQANDYLNVKDVVGVEDKVQLNVTVENNQVDGTVIQELAGKDIDLLIKGDHEIRIPCYELNANESYHSINLGYSLEKVDKLSKNMINVIGETDAFTLKFDGSGNYKITMKISLGKEYAYQNASIYQREGSGYNFIQTVQVDGSGYASFYFDGFDQFTTYLIGINVDSENVLIPEELYGDYGYLMDEHGNKYEITGIKSKWGINIIQLTWIVVGALVLVIGLVGGVMFMMFKRQQANERIRKEVMSEGYSKEENIKKSKTTKRKLFDKKKK